MLAVMVIPKFTNEWTLCILSFDITFNIVISLTVMYSVHKYIANKLEKKLFQI